MSAPVVDVEHEMKILNWYKLANEAALKSALVKNKKARQQPRYNPAAESVKERTRWLQRVIAEEQSRPLEVPEHVYKQLLKQEQDQVQRLEDQMWRRKERLKNLQQQTLSKEYRRMRYHNFLRVSEQQKLEAEATARSLGILQQEDYEDVPSFNEMSPETKQARDEEIEQRAAAMHKQMMVHLENLEDQVQGIVRSRTSHGPRSVAVTVSAPDWQGSSSEVEHNAHVAFVKKRTEGKLSSPSKVFYSVRLLPSATPSMNDNVLAPLDVGGNNSNNRSEMRSAEPWMGQRRPNESRSSSSALAPPPRRSMSAPVNHRPMTTTTDDGKFPIDLEKEVKNARERSSRTAGGSGGGGLHIDRRAREEERREQEQQKQERVNLIIKDWLQGRVQRKIAREKKIKDRIKADKNFLQSLQVTRERENKEREQDAKAGSGNNAANNNNNNNNGNNNNNNSSTGINGNSANNGDQSVSSPMKGGGGSKNITIDSPTAGEDLSAAAEAALFNTGNFMPRNGSSSRQRRGGVGAEVFELDEEAMDRRLDLLMQQQQRMELWKPRVGSNQPQQGPSASSSSLNASRRSVSRESAR